MSFLQLQNSRILWIVILIILAPTSYALNTEECQSDFYNMSVISYENGKVIIEVNSSIKGKASFYLIPSQDSDWFSNRGDKQPYFSKYVYPSNNTFLYSYYINSSHEIIQIEIPSYVYPWYYRVYSYIYNQSYCNNLCPCDYNEDNQFLLAKETKVILNEKEKNDFNISVEFPIKLIAGQYFYVNFSIYFFNDANYSCYSYIYNGTKLLSYGCSQKFCNFSWKGNEVIGFSRKSSKVNFSLKGKVVSNYSGYAKIKLRCYINGRRYDFWKRVYVEEEAINTKLKCKNGKITFCNFYKDNNFTLLLQNKTLTIFVKKGYCKYFQGNYAIILLNGFLIDFCFDVYHKDIMNASRESNIFERESNSLVEISKRGNTKNVNESYSSDEIGNNANYQNNLGNVEEIIEKHKVSGSFISKEKEIYSIWEIIISSAISIIVLLIILWKFGM